METAEIKNNVKFTLLGKTEAERKACVKREIGMLRHDYQLTTQLYGSTSPRHPKQADCDERTQLALEYVALNFL